MHRCIWAKISEFTPAFSGLTVVVVVVVVVVVLAVGSIDVR